MTPVDCPLPELRRVISIEPNGRLVIAGVAEGRYELRLVRLNERNQNPDFLAAVKNWGEAVHLEENGSEQVQLSPVGEDAIE